MIDLELISKEKSKFFTTVFLTLLAATILSTSIGFTALNQNLNIAGDIDYDEHSVLLYDVLKKESNKGTYAKEYTGEHHDSFTEYPSHKIYHWYANDDSNGNQLANEILNRNNVLFNNMCWQMIRTTDTGGVKLIYNGLPNEGKCNNTGEGQQIGTSPYNSNYTSPADVGYMYNTRYVLSTKSVQSGRKVLDSHSLTYYYSYYYGTGVEYVDNQYHLTGVTYASWYSTYDRAEGMYTCASTTSSTCSQVYYITRGYEYSLVGFQLKNGNMPDYYEKSLVIGDSFTNDGNGTYIINNPITVKYSDWARDFSNYEGYFTCNNNSDRGTFIYYISDTFNSYYTTIDGTNNYTYSNGFTYDQVNNIYMLDNDREQQIDPIMVSNSHHYTCHNNTGQCTEISYITGSRSTSMNGQSGYMYLNYLKLRDGKSIEDSLNEMFYSDDVNQIDSSIKNQVEEWYLNNMIDVRTQIEDTIYCNDRSQENELENAWNPNGGRRGEELKFSSFTPDNNLGCTNITDQFSTNNNKAKTNYPVGLITSEEASLLNNKLLRTTGNRYWTMSPAYYEGIHNSAKVKYIYSTGDIYTGNDLNQSFGVRPVISLKPGTEYSMGDGSRDNPYIVLVDD